MQIRPPPVGTVTETQIILPTATLISTILPTEVPEEIEENESTPSPVVESSWQQGKMVFALKVGYQHALYMIDFSASDRPELILAPSGDNFYIGPLLSYDGSKIAFYNLSENTQIISANFGAQPRYLADCTQPSWSPNREEVICRSLETKTFQVYDADTGKLLRDTNISGYLPAWSPSGTDDIIFADFDSNRNTRVLHFMLNDWRGMERVVPLAYMASENYAPAWSPDGQMIAYQSNLESDDSQIWVMDQNGFYIHELIELGNWSRGPAWSPDGQWITFVSGASDSVGADYGEVFVVSMINGDVYQVTHTNGMVYD